MKTAEIRQAFLDYFKSKGHSIVTSSSLVPAGDPTLLFVNAGMVQFKDCFLGSDKRSYLRATTCQKSLRISGKHNDLENVGRTARHHTFFEMLGNFSFGDYFKTEAIKFAWEFLTEVLKLDKRRLWVTIFEEDDEAGKLWAKHTDVLAGRILRCGKDDNFWAMGETGPCGPCTEIHYFLGADLENQSESDFRNSDGSYVEIWNLVFMQFNRNSKGELSPLPKPSVDTGMGLERIAAVKQGVRANYDTDLLRAIITFTEKLSGKSYLGENYSPTTADPQYEADVAFRVIADHLRACSFLIADGVTPSSDGRGYVLRRLIRRACRHARVLGFNKSSLFQVAEEVVRLMFPAYPELKQNADKISKTIRAEEEKFLLTLDTGIKFLSEEINALRSRASRTVSGEIAFLLHDTYGFPLDLTEDLARAQGLNVDLDGFSMAMEAQRERSRTARSSETELVLQRVVKPSKTTFVGYEFSEYESTIVGLFNSSGEIKTAKEGSEVIVLTNATPFYAESGGQVGDTGTISSNQATLDVIDTQKVAADTFCHICRVVDGDISVGEAVRLSIDTARRQKLRIHHSATHLLHLALREVLGAHVHQAGSRVSDKNLRFDFSHTETITAAQIQEIELYVNAWIQENHPVITRLMPLDEAKKGGAMALFGEKYSAEVRVVQIGPKSLELCGGTHAMRSGDLGYFTIVGESSVSAGVRRLEAVSGAAAVQKLNETKKIVSTLTSLLHTGEADLSSRVEKLVNDNKRLEKQLERLGQAQRATHGADLSSQAITLADGTKVIASKLPDSNPKELREFADNLRNRIGSGCIALASVSEGKAILLTAVTEDLVGRYHAGKLIEQMAKVVGSRGGGRADLAQAGGGDPEKIDEALKRFSELL